MLVLVSREPRLRVRKITRRVLRRRIPLRDCTQGDLLSPFVYSPRKKRNLFARCQAQRQWLHVWYRIILNLDVCYRRNLTLPSPKIAGVREKQRGNTSRFWAVCLRRNSTKNFFRSGIHGLVAAPVLLTSRILRHGVQCCETMGDSELLVAGA